jgi:hypothetical protein
MVAAAAVALLALLAWWVSRSPLPTVELADGLTARCLNRSAWPTVPSAVPSGASVRSADDEPSWPLTVAAHEVPEIEIESRRPLESVTFEFGRRAAASIELEGGRVAERILHPDGRVAFRIVPEPPQRHRAWPRAAVYRYRFEWLMPAAPGGPLGMSVTAVPENSTP